METNMSTKINSPKFAFYYLLSLVALIFSALSVGMIAFQYINKYMPDIFGQIGQDFSPDVLKFAVSAIIIAAPIFFITTNLIYKSLVAGKLEKDSGIRRWLTYFILFVAAVIIITFLIITVNSFLSGNWTAKFLLQMLTVIGIAAIIFTFYLYDIRRAEVNKTADKILRLYFWMSLVIMAIAFVAALFIVESPAVARGRLIDERIISNFQAIEGDVSNYYSYYQKLPATLAEVKAMNNASNIYIDPATNKEFGYNIVSTSSYQLCADFRTDDKNNVNAQTQYLDENLRHLAGAQCLNFKIYPENTKVVPAAPGNITAPANSTPTAPAAQSLN